MATITQTVLQTVTTTAAAAASPTPNGNRAAPQGGIFEGLNPTRYDTKNPITLFVIQAVIVIAFTRILHWPLSKLRQPRVIAEVITVSQALINRIDTHVYRASYSDHRSSDGYQALHSTSFRQRQCQPLLWLQTLVSFCSCSW